MSSEIPSPDEAGQPRSLPSELIRQLSADPGAPVLDALTDYVSAVHVRLFGLARERSRAASERCAAILQLGQECVAAGESDPKGVKPQVRQLLRALQGREELEPDASSEPVLAALAEALSHCP